MNPRIAVLIVLVVAGAIALFWKQSIRAPRTVSGILESDEIRVGSRVGGRVLHVPIKEGDEVSAGTVLIELEPFDLEQRLAEAQGQLSAARANFAKLQAGFRPEEIAEAAALLAQAKARLEEAVAGPRQQEIQQARESLRQAEADLELAIINYERAENLLGRKAIPKEDFDEISSKRKSSQAAVQVRKEQLALLEEGTRAEQIAQARAQVAVAEALFQLRTKGYRTEDIEEARAQEASASATVAVLERQIAELKVTAPSTSTVEAVDLQPGDLVPANAPVISLLDRGRLWVRAYVSEDLLGLVKENDVLPVSVDTFPDHRFAGRVTYVSRNAEFTPSNVQTPEERGQQVFRFKVEVDLTQPLSDRLRPGMSADVHLDERTP